jgi:hypothetical protein
LPARLSVLVAFSGADGDRLLPARVALLGGDGGQFLLVLLALPASRSSLAAFPVIDSKLRLPRRP